MLVSLEKTNFVNHIAIIQTDNQKGIVGNTSFLFNYYDVSEAFKYMKVWIFRLNFFVVLTTSTKPLTISAAWLQLTNKNIQLLHENILAIIKLFILFKIKGYHKSIPFIQINMKAKFRFWITIICCIGIGFPIIIFNLFWVSKPNFFQK